jgi:hypothetical protein
MIDRQEIHSNVISVYLITLTLEPRLIELRSSSGNFLAAKQQREDFLQSI